MKRLSLRQQDSVEDAARNVELSSNADVSVENMKFLNNSGTVLSGKRSFAAWDRTADLNEIGENECRGCDGKQAEETCGLIGPLSLCYRRKVDWMTDNIIRKTLRRNVAHSSISNALIPLNFDPSLPVLGPKPLNDLPLLARPGIEDDEVDNIEGDQQIFGLDHSLYEYHIAISRANEPHEDTRRHFTKFSGDVSHGECFLNDEDDSDDGIKKATDKSGTGGNATTVTSSNSISNDANGFNDDDMEIL